jgi:Na+-driven multidrug efflux pump
MRRVLVVSLALQWGLMLPLAYTAGPILGYGILAIWIVLSLWRALGCFIYGFLWHNRGWAEIHV